MSDHPKIWFCIDGCLFLLETQRRQRSISAWWKNSIKVNGDISQHKRALRKLSSRVSLKGGLTSLCAREVSYLNSWQPSQPPCGSFFTRVSMWRSTPSPMFLKGGGVWNDGLNWSQKSHPHIACWCMYKKTGHRATPCQWIKPVYGGIVKLCSLPPNDVKEPYI